MLVSQVIINRCQELARFALMHCIASSLCFWIWTILRETLDSLNSYATHGDYSADGDGARSQGAEPFENSVALPLTVNQQSKSYTIRNLILSFFLTPVFNVYSFLGAGGVGCRYTSIGKQTPTFR
jgi:hypothetical protein